MTKQLNPSSIASIKAFAFATSVATARVNDFSARLAIVSGVCDRAALCLSNLCSSAAQKMASSQRLATHCQCICSPQNEKATNLTSYANTAEQTFVLSTAILAGAKLWGEALKWLWKLLGPNTRKWFGALGLLVLEIPALLRSGVVTTFIATIGRFTASIAAWTASPWLALSVEIALGSAALGGAIYLLWRNWSTIVSTIRTVARAISREASAFMREVATAISGTFQHITRENLELTDEVPRQRNKTSAAHYFTQLPFLASQSSTPVGVGPRFLQRAGSLRGATLAMLAAPLLAGPSLATVASRQSSIDGVGSGSIVINSSPTITVNCNEADDIHSRILEALRQHREAIYEQWCSEVQRRQRTEL